jgi:phenylalanyl-tRNA synthetase beta chain
MKISKRWIEQFVDISDIDIDALVNKLTMAGFEVDTVTKISENKDVVVGLIKEVKPLLKSEHLKVCLVSDGKNDYNVVCGASNVSKGLIVPFAKPGAKLFNNLEIRETEIMGAKSEGMICSLEELGLEENSSGIMALTNDYKLGDSINDIFELPDYILEVSITPNRGDCLSIRGLSREIAAICDRTFRDISFELKENSSDKVEQMINVDVLDGKACPLYVGKVIKDIKIDRAPTFMEIKLKKIGLKSINNVVDISNYILIEVGQPLHTFDLDKIKEGIIVRRAKDREWIKLLDERIINLGTEILVICDLEKPLAIAGVMGGEYSGITDQTKNVFLESAFFLPSAIRKSAKKTNLSTDASYRFERGVDPGETENMANYAAYLLQKYANGKVLNGIIKKSAINEKEKRSVFFSFSRINNLLGYTIDAEVQKSIFKRLNIELKEDNEESLAVIPTYRQDIELEADLAEEVARIYGYEKIPATDVKIDANSKPPDFMFCKIRDIRSILKNLGFIETINYSFIDERYLRNFYLDEKFIRLKNPISEDMNVLRMSLFPSLIKNTIFNKRMGHEDIRLFEVSTVFGEVKDEQLSEENTHLSFITTENFWPLHWLQKGSIDNFYIVKGVADHIFKALKLQYKIKRSNHHFLHPGKSADLIINNELVGFIGELHPSFYESLDISTKIYIAEVFLSKILEIASEKKIKYEKYSIYPYVTKDLSLIVDESIMVSQIIELIYTISPLIKSVWCYDVYSAEHIGLGKKSLTFRIIFSSISKTLTDKETNEVLVSVIDKCKEEFNIILR